MIITYYGKAFIRLSFGDMVIAINPISKESAEKSARFGADIVLSSLHKPSFNGVAELSAGTKESFDIIGPGEYELAGVFVRGYESMGPTESINTIYTIVLEGMKICHLGALAGNNLAPEVVEDISGADILFVPVGDENSLGAKEAAKLASSLIPKLIIPVLYGSDQKSTLLTTFLKEIGSEKTEETVKLSLKKKDLEGKEAEVVCLTTS